MRSSHILTKTIAIILALAFAVAPISGAANTVSTLEQSRVQHKEPEVVVKKVDVNQLTCLADNIYYEAGGESTEGKAAVARVVLNRMNHGGFGSTPCKVVYQTTSVLQTNDEETFWVKVCQFSWVCEGKGNPNRKSHRYQSSLQVAKDVLIYDKYSELLPKKALFFHNTSIVNRWPHEVVATIGNHIFYVKKAKNVRKQTHRNSKVSAQGRVHTQDVPR